MNGLFLRLRQKNERVPSVASIWRAMFCVVCIGYVPSAANGQVLRIGGFDFNAKARSELVYSTNVERQRSNVTSEKPEDYFLVLGLDLTSVRPVGRSTTIDLSTGVSMEKHFVRDDLDNSHNPFGHFAISAATDVGKLSLQGFAAYNRLSQSASDKFSTDGLARARDPREEIRYGGGVSYRATRLTMGVDYRHREESHDEVQFADRDQQQDTVDAYVVYKMHERFEPMYMYNSQETVLPANPSGSRTQINHRYILPFTIIMEHPRLQYAFTWQKEDKGDGIPPGWKPRHMVSIGDTRELSKSLSINWQAMYDNYPQPVQDQIQFTYGASLRHQISRTAQQELGVTRQPVETFGSTLKSDQTMYRYNFTKNDLFIYDLNLSFSLAWQHTVPMGDENEEAQNTKTYDTRLTHRRSLTRRLQRTWGYDYRVEDSSVQPELLTEHRVTLKYEYQF